MTYNQDSAVANTNFTQKRTSMSSQDDPLRGAEARSAPVATLCAMFDHAVATAPDSGAAPLRCGADLSRGGARGGGPGPTPRADSHAGRGGRARPAKFHSIPHRLLRRAEGAGVARPAQPPLPGGPTRPATSGGAPPP